MDLVLARHTANRILRTLSTECQELIRLFFYDQLTHEAIAQRLGIPLGTVKSRMFRCLGKAKERFAGTENRRAATDPTGSQEVEP